MDKLFRRINGRCPYCEGEVNIVEGMVFDYILDEDGIPKYLNSEEYKVAGYCRNCKRALYVLPNTCGGYNVYPNDAICTSPYMLNSIKRVSAFGIKLLESEDNPFVNATSDIPNQNLEYKIVIEDEDDDCPF